MVPNYVDFEVWVKINLTKSFSSTQNITWQNTWTIAVWMIWRWRCASIHDDGFQRPHDPVMIIKNFGYDYEKSSEILCIENDPIHRNEVTVIWEKPAVRWVKLNCDAARKTNQIISACGGLLRDCNGVWIGGFCRLLGSTSVLRAEAWGLLDGIQFASSLALDSLEIECDLKVLVDSVTNRCLICLEIARIIVAVRACLASFRH